MNNYRGKSIEKSEWVYGDLINVDGKTYIIDFDCVDHPEINGSPREWWTFYNEVDSETVGQYTGLTIHDSIKIYEGQKFIYAGKNFVVVYSNNELSWMAKYADSDGIPLHGFNYSGIQLID